MAKVVELSGSPGVGKTTLYKEIITRWNNKKSNWIPGHYLCPHPNLSLEYTRLFISTFIRKIKGKAVGVFDDVKAEARNRFVAQNEAYIDTCWNDITLKQKKSFNGLDLRLLKAQQLAESIESFQILKESKNNKYAITEEGLIHLLDVLNFCTSTEDITNTLNVMPLPDALVNIQANTSENVKRIMQRDKIITIHKLLSAGQLEQITKQSKERRDIINNILQKKGIPILNIDSQEDIKFNADRIISFIEAL